MRLLSLPNLFIQMSKETFLEEDFMSKSEIQKKWNDFVFVVKTKVKLDKKNILSLKSFYKNLNFLINKI